MLQLNKCLRACGEVILLWLGPTWFLQGDRYTSPAYKVTPAIQGNNPLVLEYDYEEDIDASKQASFVNHTAKFYAPDLIAKAASLGFDPSKYTRIYVHATPTSGTTCRFFSYTETNMESASWVQRLFEYLPGKIAMRHLFNHVLLDGDTLLLRGAAKRLRSAEDVGKSWITELFMPYSIDQTVTGYRRWVL